MSIDQSINNRLALARERNRKKRPTRKSKSLSKKLRSAFETVENFILFNHLKEGRVGLALGSIGARILAGIITRPLEKLSKRPSVLSRRRKDRKANSAKRLRLNRRFQRAPRRRVPEARRTLI